MRYMSNIIIEVMIDSENPMESVMEIIKNDPILVVKWAFVLVVLVVAFIITFKIRNKIDPAISPYERLDKKIAKAKEKGHVINADRIKSYYTDRDDGSKSDNRTYHGFMNMRRRVNAVNIPHIRIVSCQ